MQLYAGLMAFSTSNTASSGLLHPSIHNLPLKTTFRLLPSTKTVDAETIQASGNTSSPLRDVNHKIKTTKTHTADPNREETYTAFRLLRFLYKATTCFLGSFFLREKQRGALTGMISGDWTNRTRGDRAEDEAARVS